MLYSTPLFDGDALNIHLVGFMVSFVILFPRFAAYLAATKMPTTRRYAILMMLHWDTFLESIILHISPPQNFIFIK